MRNAVLGNNSAAPITDVKAKQYIMAELDLEIAVYTKRYIDEAGTAQKFIDDDVFVMFPSAHWWLA